ncbi:MAG: hypothetical protein N2691_00350 [Patescibacteria group bacterium]|nr:hypothetical protein [Patescibacteria group bacterium]
MNKQVGGALAALALTVFLLLGNRVLAQTPVPPTPNPTEFKTLFQAILETLFGKSSSDVPQELENEMPSRLRNALRDALSGTPFPSDVPLEEWMTEDETGPNNSAVVLDNAILENYTPGDESLATYGLTDSRLKQPSEAIVQGLYEQLLRNPLRSWARDCLIYEKALKGKISDIRPYLSCAWVWFEGALDPNAVNCKDNSSRELRQSVAEPCSAANDRPGDQNSMLQVGGYQAFDQAVYGHYAKYFPLCHAESNFNRVLSRAFTNSSSSVNPFWSYGNQAGKKLVAKFKDEVDSVPFSVIARNKSQMDLLGEGGEPLSPAEREAEERTQFFTLLLGKDPCMRVALNASAVASLPNDIKRRLETGRGWAKYVVENVDRLSGMLLALRKFDREVVVNEVREIRDNRSSQESSGSSNASFNPNFGNVQIEQFCQCDQRWNQGGNDDICMSGCGLTSMAMIFSALGSPTVPTNAEGTGTYDVLKGRYWSRAVGMNTLLGALKDDYTRGKGFVVAKTRVAPVQAAEIAPFLTGENRGRCLVFGSQKKVDGNTFNHIFPIVDADPATNRIDVRDTWRSPVCRPRAGREISNFQDASQYANYYYIAVCKS